MFLKKLAVQNYKSLKDLSFEPGQFSVVAGPNGAGKTNLADVFHFLSEVYTHGLEVAIARKGGYENIAFRKMRRTKSPISVEVIIECDPGDFPPRGGRTSESRRKDITQFRHTFTLAAKGTGIKSEFRVVEETFTLAELDNSKGRVVFKDVLRVTRDSDNFKLVVDPAFRKTKGRHYIAQLEFAIGLFKPSSDSDIALLRGYRLDINSQELLVASLLNYTPWTRMFSQLVAGFRVFHISPQGSRASGAPTPNPLLSMAGENLPAIVDWLKRNHSKEWQGVMAAMSVVLPDLTDISVEYLHNRALGLVFHESQVGRPWSSDDVSDGTIRTLALLVASVDPRSSLIMLEEPENSLHPWIIRQLVEWFRKISESKTVILTTHSPVLLDLVRPNEIWICSRHDGATFLQPLSQINSEIQIEWEDGKSRIFDFLDSGLVSTAVPGGAI